MAKKITAPRFLRGAASRVAASADDGSFLVIKRVGKRFFSCTHDASTRRKSERLTCDTMPAGDTVARRRAIFARNYR
jgi:hypothetical protein